MTVVVRCNICDQEINIDAVQEHIQTSHHISRKSELDKKVANLKKPKSYPANDSSIHIWEALRRADSYVIDRTINRFE